MLEIKSNQAVQAKLQQQKIISELMKTKKC